MRWVCTIADGEFYNGVGDVARASLVLQRQGEDGELVFKRAGKQGDSPLTSLHPSAEITIGCPHDPINQEALAQGQGLLIYRKIVFTAFSWPSMVEQFVARADKHLCHNILV